VSFEDFDSGGLAGDGVGGGVVLLLFIRWGSGIGWNRNRNRNRKRVIERSFGGVHSLGLCWCFGRWSARIIKLTAAVLL
jgi:hypothetical protein